MIAKVYCFVFLSFLVGARATNKPEPFSKNFKVVVDKSSGNSRSVPGKNAEQGSFLVPSSHKNSNSEFNKKLEKILSEATVLKEKLTEEAQHAFESVKKRGKELAKTFEHYSKLEIGAYTTLAVVLTVALKNLVFSKPPYKTLDIAVISYILNSPAAKAKFANVEPVKELSRRKLKVALSPSISSTDSTTYRRTVPKIPKRVPKKIPPPPPARPAQVVVDTVTAFYEEHGAHPASHNAVIKTMTPAMRQRLRARRMRGGAAPSALLNSLKVGFYFAAWYALNVVYNIVNKKVLNVLPAPLTVGTLQFGVGALYCALVWLLRLRPLPSLTSSGKSAVARVGLFHSFGQLATVLSLGAGPVSFTHIVKAMEPLFSALVSGLVFKKWMKPQVYLTLLPVVGGVGYACMKELSFSWLAFGAAMASNMFFALRAVMSKLALQSGSDAGTNLTSPNLFGLVTWAALFISIPIALLGEGRGFIDLWTAALESVENSAQLVRTLVLSGLFHYLNNEVMYLALGSVHPVTLAVGNTMKRVFILVASVMVFKNPVSVQAMIGSGVGIAGVLVYSLTKQHYEAVEAREKASTPAKKTRGFNKKNKSKAR